MVGEGQKEDRVAALAAAYRAHLAEVRTSVGEALGAFQHDASAPGDLIALREIVHKIAGSAAIYDYEQVGDAAQATEAAIIDVSHVANQDESISRLKDSLQRLLYELDTALGTEPNPNP